MRNRIQQLLQKKNFRTFLLLVPIVFIIFLYSPLTNLKSKNEKIGPSSERNNNISQEVLGRYYRSAQLYIYGGDQAESSGGMIALASTDTPAVSIGGYQISGQAQIMLYKANESVLLDYLTHDEQGKQLKKSPDVSKLQYVTTVKKDINTGNNSYEGAQIALPLEDIGIWYLKVTLGKTNTSAFIIRSDTGIYTKEGDNELIFWGQSFKTKRSISGGTVRVLNLQGGKNELQTINFSNEGIAKAAINEEADIALIQIDNDRAIVPINLKYLNTNYSYKPFQPKSNLTRYFIFTDRPLYKPGDTVNFKAVLRNDDDVRYTVPAGEAMVKIYDGYYYEGSTDSQPVFEKSYPISQDGTVNGQYQLPADSNTGYYSLTVSIPNQSGRGSYWNDEWSSNTTSFNVEFFKKPEFSIDIITPKTELIAGDKTSFKIRGTYFSGQPLIGQDVSYSVYSSDYYEYQYLSDQQNYSNTLSDEYRYGSWYGGNKVIEGTAKLDKTGEAEIKLDTRINFNKGKSQVFSIEATIKDGSIEPSFARRNLLVYAGEYGIYRTDFSYGGKVNTKISIPLTLLPTKEKTKVGSIDLTAKLHRENWVSYQEENKKYPSYKKEEEDLPPIKLSTDSRGNAAINFTPGKVGYYKVNVEGKDTRGNTVSKLFYAYISSEDLPYYTEGGGADLTIASDKQKYQPTDTVKFNIFSTIPDRDVFLSLERGRVNRFQVVRLNGKSGTVEVPLVETDVPNIYAEVTSFSQEYIDTSTVNVPVSADGKKLVVKISTDAKKYGPGETVAVDIATSDIKGNPVSAELALWTVDKAIFELSDNKLGDIFDTFWKERNDSTVEAHSLEGILVRQAEGGGCFAEGTRVLMADGSLKSIESVKEGDYVLTRTETNKTLKKAKVSGTHKTTAGGYLIINSKLRVTANHIMWVNNSWKEGGSIQIGDVLIDQNGKSIKVNSIEWQRGKYNVYNLEIENYHTYFADGFWVHNDKGTERDAFKDTAYWNPSVKTDVTGKARVSFVLPDNLTTWTLAAVGATSDTQVGQTTDEIFVTKDLIVRPIIPNILRIGDELFVSALVQNFSDKDQKFNIDLKFDSGNVERAQYSNESIKSSETKQIYWKIKPTKESNKSKLKFSAVSTTDKKTADIVTYEIPIRPFGFYETKASTGEDNKTFAIDLAADSDSKKTTAKLSLSPTIVGSLPTAMEYLIGYPYGCVEQTTSRFVPAVIAKANKQYFADALSDKDINDIIQKGVSRLSALQLDEGGWAWWFSGESDPYLTSYVVEYLLQAKQLGISVDESMLRYAKTYLQQERYYDPKKQDTVSFSRESLISKNYGLTLLGEGKNIKKVTDLSGLTTDLLSLAVMTNYLNGDTNPQTNGLNILISQAKKQGDVLYWNEGSKFAFGSKDASTALAIRAILFAGGDREIAAKGARYLVRNRKFQYWSNTYGTAQVIRALTEFSKTGNELNPNYSYTVELDGKQIAKGAVNSSKQIIKDISIPAAKIKGSGSNIVVKKNGNGQLYSTLVIDEFHTDRKAKAVDHGLTVKREYINEKGKQYTLAVGDTAIVNITVSGLKANENYGAIVDELPSGMVPINENFNNQQYGNNSNYYYNSYNVTDKEIAENGVVLSLYKIASGERTYTYKARVVSEGNFYIPPVMAHLMYAPEIYGRSSADKMEITKISKVIPGVVPETNTLDYLRQNGGKIGAAILFALIVILLFLKKRGVTNQTIIKKINQLPVGNFGKQSKIENSEMDTNIQDGNDQK